MAIQPTMANTLEYGLISEFSYLTKDKVLNNRFYGMKEEI
jgi:hypothetical protein